MDISIITSTWNNCKRLKLTIQAISRCQIPAGVEWEWIIVNNNSTDETDQVIERYKQDLPVIGEHELRQGNSFAKNKALEVAQGRLIIFADDDITPEPEWICAYWQAYQEKPEGYFFGGPIESEFEGQKPSEDLLKLTLASVHGFDLAQEPHEVSLGTFFIGPNWAAPLKIIREAGGFDTKRGLNQPTKNMIIGEETELMYQLVLKGCRGWYIPEAKVKHFVPQFKTQLPHLTKRAEAKIRESFLRRHPLDRKFFGLGIPILAVLGICKCVLKLIVVPFYHFDTDAIQLELLRDWFYFKIFFEALVDRETYPRKS